MSKDTSSGFNRIKLQDFNFYLSDSVKEVINFIVDNDIESVFEGGCGTGFIPHELRNRGYTGKYLGSDYNKQQLGYAKLNNPKEEFKNIDLRKKIQLADKRFDASVVMDTFDYIYPYDKTLRELIRITKKYIIICLCRRLEDADNIGFTDLSIKGKYYGNTYDRKKWYKTIDKLKIITDKEILQDDEYKHQLFILGVNENTSTAKN